MTPAERAALIKRIDTALEFYSVHDGPTDLLIDCRAALESAAPAERKPDGYAYRYHDCIRFNGGGDVNGGKPLQTIPYYFGAAPADTAREIERLTGLEGIEP